jgi:hypothetical protein
MDLLRLFDRLDPLRQLRLNLLDQLVQYRLDPLRQLHLNPLDQLVQHQLDPLRL